MAEEKKPIRFSNMEGFIRPSNNLNKQNKVKPKEVKEEDPNEDRTEEAIEDIVISDSNSLLKIEDQKIAASKKKKKRFPKLRKILTNKWLYLALGIVIILVFLVPYTRYKILGLFISNRYYFQVVDSQTKTAIAGSVIEIDGKKIKTDIQGQANIMLHIGNYNYSVSKPYYQRLNGKVFVGLKQSNTTVLNMRATGRPVTISVLNKFTNAAVSKAKIVVLGSDYYTDKNGKATMILSTHSESYKAYVSASGYANTVATIVVSLNNSPNIITMVPSGNVYFLSTDKGKVNLIKSNLDGSSQSTLVAGTGREDPNNTKLYVSGDNKYLILLANRTGVPQLYNVDASSGGLTQIESQNNQITPFGFIADSFVYDFLATASPTSTAAREQIKSYNPVNKQITVLDQNEVKTADNGTYAYSVFSNFNLMPTQLVYTTTWSISGEYDLKDSIDTIRSVSPGVAKPQDYFSFNALTSSGILTKRFSPQAIYISVLNLTNNQISYYQYTKGSVTPVSIDKDTSQKSYPTFYISPLSSMVIYMNGATLELADSDANNPKALKYNGYNFYSWYNTNLILLSNNSKLYLAPINNGKPSFIAQYLAN